MKRSLGVLLSFLLGALAIGPLPAAGIGGDPGPGCAVDWTAARQSTALLGGSPITDARAGRHECFDRFVIDMQGGPPGVTVRYVDEFRREALPPLRGAAVLAVLLFNDDLTFDPPEPGEVVDVTGFRSFRQIAFDVGFERQLAFGIGVRERLPFRVFTLAGPGAGSRVVVDVAHAWTGSSAPRGASPVGNFESAAGVAGGVQVTGWMLDPDTPDPIYAWVTVDGAGRHLYANVNRPDVGAAFPGYGSNHGFLGTVPTSAGAHRVCVTAANIGPGNHTPLGCRNVTVPNSSPFGNYESARGVFGAGVEVRGWLADPSAPTSPIFGWVTIDGAGQHVLADQNRPDVGAAYPGYGSNHGFRNSLAAGPGRHEVCVTASNVGPGSHTPLGCRTVGVFAQPVVWPAAHVALGTPAAAAADFVTKALGVPAQLGPFQQGDANSGEIEVLFSAGGPSVVRGTLFLRRLGMGDSWFVLGAAAEGMSIAAPTASAEVSPGLVTVEGLGRGFEGLVVVEAFRAGSTTLLDQETATAGSAGTPEPYSVTLDLSGASPGDVVTILVRGGVGNEDDPGDFSAIPIVVAD